jgi:hypothetical protein
VGYSLDLDYARQLHQLLGESRHREGAQNHAEDWGTRQRWRGLTTRRQPRVPKIPTMRMDKVDGSGTVVPSLGVPRCKKLSSVRPANEKASSTEITWPQIGSLQPSGPIGKSSTSRVGSTVISFPNPIVPSFEVHVN